MSIVGGTLGQAAAVVLAGLVVSAVGVGAAISTGVVSPAPPTVESVENEWGEISEERTGIQTRVVVNNPNGVGIPGVASVSYDVAMNDVRVASGSSDRLALSPGSNDVTLQSRIDNGKIPAWWASHINNGERTTVSVRPSVEAVAFSKDLPGQNRTFETDILSSFDDESDDSVTVGGRTLLTVESTQASWGHATENRTPLRFAGTIHNPNDAPISFSKIGYAVSMNDVTVAEGTTEEGVDIGANSTNTIRVNSTLDNQKLDEWWVTHLRNDEKSTLDVQVFAVVETDDGTRRVPLPFLSKRVAFETDILGGGQATTRSVETGDGLGFEPPEIESVDREWRSTGSGTRFSTSVVVNNPASASSTVDVALDARYRVSLNDVTLVEDEQRTTLQSGRNELDFGDDVSDRTIRKWWVSHVENGERTDLTTESRVTADLGFVEAPVALPDKSRTFETDMLPEFAQTDQKVEVRGRTVATLHDMESDWGEPTMERTPMIVSGDVTNERARSMTIVTFGYEVAMNDVVLANNETAVGTTVPGKTTRSIDTEAYLDNGKIDEWWVSHLENGERSELSVSYYVVVEFGGDRYRVSLDSMSYNKTVETNAFGGQ